MQLKDMLFPECTLIHVKADRKEDVIWKLYEKLLQNGKVKENFYEAVLEREREYPTGLKFEKFLMFRQNMYSNLLSQSQCWMSQ